MVYFFRFEFVTLIMEQWNNGMMESWNIKGCYSIIIFREDKFCH